VNSCFYLGKHFSTFPNDDRDGYQVLNCARYDILHYEPILMNQKTRLQLDLYRLLLAVAINAGSSSSGKKAYSSTESS